ncbi:hypothetical protein Tco_0581698 [Tanacetum coccineum]
MSTLSSIITKLPKTFGTELSCLCETLHQYYLWFAQLINDINIIQMIMQPVQVNTKFLNSLPPEWGKFMTDVKLARDLHTSNYDQLYAYLEQYELCLHHVIPQPTINSDLLLIRGVKPLFKMVESPFSKFKEDKVRMLSIQVHNGMLQPKRIRDATWFKENVLLVHAQAEGKELGEEQLAFLADPGVADDAYDSDCDDISSAKAVLMANLSCCDSDVLSEYSEQTPIVDYPNNEITSDSNIIPYSQYLEETQQAIANNESKIVNESLTAELERYKEIVKILEQRFNVDLSGRAKFIDSQMT